MPDISPLAIVEKSAKLADDVRVGAFSFIGRKVKIAPGCVIENNVTITGRTVLGEKNHVFPMTVIGTPMDGPDGGGKCILGEANVIREHVTVYTTRGRVTRIGNDNLIMIGCVIGPGAQMADHGIFDNLTNIGADATVEDYVWTSGYTKVESGTTVGAYTFTVGYSCIDRDAPPYAMVQGFPIRVRGVNTRNLKRCGFGDDDVRALKVAFRELFNGATDFVNDEALVKLRGHTNPHVRRLVESVQRSQDGRRAK